MNRLIFLLIVALFSTWKASALEAGAAKVEITPPLGTPLNGYGDRLGKGSLSVHDPVWSRSLYVSDGTTAIMLVNVDLCVINRELRDRVLELAPPEVPRENILLTATHTHSAQGAMNRSLVFRAVSGRFMPDVLESTAQRIVESMQSAIASRKRATIGFAVTTHDNLTENRQVEGGPVDSQIGVLRVDDSDGNPIAIAANFAAHPTTVGGDDKFAISADYPGVYYNELEAVAGESCVAMFLNGAAGNQRPANPEKHQGWAHTEWVGKRLAAKVMEAAGTITCGEATLRIGGSVPELPATLTTFLPPSTVLKTLEINDLVLTFVPGEPCVELGLELRRRAMQRGYKAQFTVSLSNDHLLYFVPREQYSGASYECGMSMYGPGIDDWMYREFDALLSKGEPSATPDAITEAQKKDVANGIALQLRGSRYAIGHQQGVALREEIVEAFDSQLVQRCEDGTLIPSEGLWSYAPAFVNLTPIALPRLGIEARQMLATLSENTFDLLEGIADGAGLPFDAVWLLQSAPTLAAQASIDAVYSAPLCTMVAITGERAGADQILLGRNFDSPESVTPVAFEVVPESGMRYAQVGYPWSAGAFTAMNEAGVAVAMERVEALGAPSATGPPIEMVLYEAITNDRSVAEVIIRLENAPHLRGYHVMIVDPVAENARVVELGESRITRVASGGVLLGMNPDFAGGDAKARYDRLAGLVRSERAIDSDELAKFMSDSEPGRIGSQRILNEFTRHSVVLEPKFRRMHVVFPGPDGKLGKPLTLTVRKSAL